ncbi:acetoacetate decarboxylase family protein [Phytohabitans sp. ZYX-F-186]|uniref:Acetoacetate decarboxylase family protein n=1 Tax=Phytohabitans maris TaxID=3071409 RepID=A0ABU0ZGS0_9ACTN|nr:acetoacetate decarboxylase family protein [Phytohabitans sp. ZYX-F-186]MDQ7906258.1 acetoacetate decarboxylase family protein [Phytohabitans sp. ZYX-F-186]
MSYPPEPWHLRGQMYVSVWPVPRAHLPPLPAVLAAEVRPLTVAGRGLVGTAWVDYGPGGVLTYRELLSAVLVRRAGRPLVSIVDIWVDSPASRDGGRALWGIPKELAELDFRATGGGLDARATAIAGAWLVDGPRLPGRWPARFSVVQALGERTRTTPVRARAAARLARAGWRVEPDGPLAYLAGRRPWLTLALRDFRMVFGR